MTTDMKRCSACGEIKQRKEFGRNRAQTDGRCGWCKMCQATRRRDRGVAPARLTETPCRTCGLRPRRGGGWEADCNTCHSRKYRESRVAGQRRRRQALRLELLVGYGGRCVRCGEEDTDVLILDHVNDDGASHRREVGNNTRLYTQLKNQGFPPTVQVLCANDNMRKERERLGIARHRVE